MDQNEMQPSLTERYYLPSVKKMRLFLTAFAILFTFGVSEELKEVSGTVLGFVFPTLYIICGYLVLREDVDLEKRILRAIGRTAICFISLTVIYFLLSLAFEPAFTLAAVATKRFWFDFIVMNVWNLPIGSTVWFVQALLYAYIAIFFLYKCKLLKFDIFFAVLFLAVTLLTGEFSSVVGFGFLWYGYFSGNFFTRALPYLLIGSFIHRKKEFFCSLRTGVYGAIAAVGVALSIGEYYALAATGHKVYTAHLFGMGLVAVALSLVILYMRDDGVRIELLRELSRFEFGIPYFVCAPVYYFLCRIAQDGGEPLAFLRTFAGPLTMLISVALFFLYALLRYFVFIIRHRNDIPERTLIGADDEPKK